MTDPTDAEIEAAALAIKRFEVGHGQLDTPDSPWGKYERDRARAALTAAAQVRERQKASLVQATTEPAESSRDHPAIVVSQAIEKLIASISHVRSRYTSGFDPSGQRWADECAEKAIAEARAAQSLLTVGLMPIYSATEDTEDYGEIVLGYRPDDKA